MAASGGRLAEIDEMGHKNYGTPDRTNRPPYRDRSNGFFFFPCFALERKKAKNGGEDWAIRAKKACKAEKWFVP